MTIIPPSYPGKTGKLTPGHVSELVPPRLLSSKIHDSMRRAEKSEMADTTKELQNNMGLEVRGPDKTSLASQKHMGLDKDQHLEITATEASRGINSVRYTRRLPQSDRARFIALSRAADHIRSLETEAPFLANQDPQSQSQKLAMIRSALKPARVNQKLPICLETKASLAELLPKWKSSLFDRDLVICHRQMATDDVKTLGKKLSMHIRHYIHALNMAIERGAAPVGVRVSCGMHISQKKLPKLKSQADLQFWGASISSYQRTEKENHEKHGDFIMSNPSTQEVKDVWETYERALKAQKKIKEEDVANQNRVEQLRPLIDELIRDIWDQVEFSCRKLAPAAKRRKARAFGVVYLSEKLITGSDRIEDTYDQDFEIYERAIVTEFDLEMETSFALVKDADRKSEASDESHRQKADGLIDGDTSGLSGKNANPRPVMEPLKLTEPMDAWLNELNKPEQA